MLGIASISELPLSTLPAAGGDQSADVPAGLIEFLGVAPTVAKSAAVPIGLAELLGVAPTAAKSAPVPAVSVEFVGVSALEGDLLSASFTAANGTGLDAYTPERGSPAVEEQGSWEIQAGAARLVASAGDNQNVAVWYLSSGHVRLRSRIALPNSDYDVGVVFNVADNDNMWLFRLAQGVADGVQIWHKSGGSFTTPAASDAFVPTQGTTIEVDVLADGDDVDCFIDGTQYIDYNAASRPLAEETGVGPRNFDDVNVASFHDFRVSGQGEAILADVPSGLIDLLGVAPTAAKSAAVSPGLLDLLGVAPTAAKSCSVSAVGIDLLGVAPTTAKSCSVSAVGIDLLGIAPTAAKSAALAAVGIDIVGLAPTAAHAAGVSIGRLQFVGIAATIPGEVLNPAATCTLRRRGLTSTVRRRGLTMTIARRA